MDPLHDLCLTCLSKPLLAHNLNDIILENLKVLEILKKLIPNLLENPELPLPNCICNECVDKLVIAYTFQKQCLNSVDKIYNSWKENFKEKVVKQEIEELVLDNFELNEDMNSRGIHNEKEISIDSLSIDKDDKPKAFAYNSTDSFAECKGEIFEYSENEEVKLENNSESTQLNARNQCKLCKKVFKLPKGLALHMVQAHLHRSLYQCKKCNKGFNMKTAYKAHCNKHMGIKTFKCEHCNKAFASITTLKQHLVCHSDETPFSCTICGKAFNRSSTLRQHLQRHNSERPYKCEKCSKTFKCIANYSKHRSLHAKKRYRCKFCDSLFITAELLQQHQALKHAEEKPFKCSQCDQGFTTRNNKDRHERLHTGVRPFRCELCYKEYFKIAEFKIHMKRKHKKKYDELEEENEESENIIDYETCSSEMNTRDYLNEYQDFDLETTQENSSKDNFTDNEVSNELMINKASIDSKDDLKILVKNVKDKDDILSEKINNKNSPEILPKNENNNELNNEVTTTTNKLQECKLCNKKFKQAHGLNLHLAKKHFRKYPFQCETCNKGFMAEEHYIKHRNRHLGIKTFKCEQCGKAFDSNSTLNQHLISHSKETPYLCTTCGKSFNRSGTLRQHMLRHSDATPFQCSECPKKFKCHSDLLCHMTIHKAEKSYECEICGKRLATSTSMVHHKLVHSGEKPFKCDFCDKSFNSSSNMKCHRRIHTGEKPYNCPYCDKTFRQSNDRNKHAKRVHAKEWTAANGKLSEEEYNL